MPRREDSALTGNATHSAMDKPDEQSEIRGLSPSIHGVLMADRKSTRGQARYMRAFDEKESRPDATRVCVAQPTSVARVRHPLRSRSSCDPKDETSHLDFDSSSNF